MLVLANLIDLMFWADIALNFGTTYSDGATAGR